MVIDTTARKITDKGVVAIDAEGKRKMIEADTVILAAGFKSNNPLEGKLKGMGPEVYAIGDCVKPGKIWGAIESAWRIARQI
jgi:glycine/D-amino acid oxidase-like deaminating enzyme